MVPEFLNPWANFRRLLNALEIGQRGGPKLRTPLLSDYIRNLKLKGGAA